jgi:protein gp37
MCDVFEDRPDLVAPRERLFKLIDATPNLTWQLLTKRPQNISRMVPRPWLDVPGAWPARVWAGTTVEDNVSADKRLPFLCDLPAPTKFVSYEPALEHVDFSPWLGSGRVTWLIFGGESGPHARPISLDWVSSFIVQGRAAGIAPFMKQMGERWAKDNRARHAHGADPMEWLPEYRVQEFPVGPARDEGYVSEMRRQLPMLA